MCSSAFMLPEKWGWCQGRDLAHDVLFLYRQKNISRRFPMISSTTLKNFGPLEDIHWNNLANINLILGKNG